MRLALLIATLTLVGCNVQPDAEIAAFGDSVTWGYGDLPGGWVRRLESKTGLTITNLGIPGERATGAAGRIDAALRTAPKARTVFVLHGGNDWVKAFRSSYCNRSCDPLEVDDKYDAIGEQLRKVRNAIEAKDKKPVFLTYWPSSPDKCDKYDATVFQAYVKHRQRLNAEIAEVAAEHDDVVLPLGDMPDFGDDGSDFYDCLHPSPQGYEKIANAILDGFGDWVPPEPEAKDLLKKWQW